MLREFVEQVSFKTSERAKDSESGDRENEWNRMIEMTMMK